MTTEEQHDRKFELTDNEYEVGLRLALVIMPSLGALYFVFGSIFHWPLVKEVSGVLLVFISLVGFLLYFSYEKHKYDGQMIIRETDGKTIYTLELDMDVEEIEDMNALIFKVVDGRS